MLSENLIKLYNTLALIETKGENTKLMAQCLAFVEGLANQVKMAEQAKTEEPVKEEETGEKDL